MANKIEETVWKMAEPIAEQAGVLVYDVEYKKEGPDYYLRVYIDRLEEGVFIEDCETVSKALSDVLDAEDPIADSYILEVSSPGLERQLKRQADFDRFCGEAITVKLFKAVAGSKQLVGALKARDDKKLVLETENGECITLENKNIAAVRLYVEF